MRRFPILVALTLGVSGYALMSYHTWAPYGSCGSFKERRGRFCKAHSAYL